MEIGLSTLMTSGSGCNGQFRPLCKKTFRLSDLPAHDHPTLPQDVWLTLAMLPTNQPPPA
jgi:hypothetical protein